MFDNMKCFLPDTPFPRDRIEMDSNGRGMLNNLRLQDWYNGVIISGSLPKCLYNENVTTLSRDEIKEALAFVEDCSGLSMNNAQVWSLEVGSTLFLQRHPSRYLAAWGYIPRYKRMEYLGKMGIESVTYYSKARSFTGYDKRIEARKSHASRLERNLLRLELRIKKDFKNVFGRPVNPWELTESKKYQHLATLWKEYYFKVPKTNELRIVPEVLTPRSFTKSLAAMTVQTEGMNRLSAMINEGRSSGLSRYNTSRLRSTLLELNNDTRLFNTRELTAELDDLVQSMTSNVA